MAKYVIVNKDYCLACGACQAASSDLFGDDEHGRSHGLLDNNTGTVPVPEELEGAAEEARAFCATEAVIVSERPFNGDPYREEAEGSKGKKTQTPGIKARLEAEIETFNRHAVPASLLLFQTENESDAESVFEAAKKRARKNDSWERTGINEVAVLLPSTSLGSALTMRDIILAETQAKPRTAGAECVPGCTAESVFQAAREKMRRRPGRIIRG